MRRLMERLKQFHHRIMEGKTVAKDWYHFRNPPLLPVINSGMHANPTLPSGDMDSIAASHALREKIGYSRVLHIVGDTVTKDYERRKLNPLGKEFGKYDIQLVGRPSKDPNKRLGELFLEPVVMKREKTVKTVDYYSGEFPELFQEALRSVGFSSSHAEESFEEFRKLVGDLVGKPLFDVKVELLRRMKIAGKRDEFIPLSKFMIELLENIDQSGHPASSEIKQFLLSHASQFFRGKETPKSYEELVEMVRSGKLIPIGKLVIPLTFYWPHVGSTHGLEESTIPPRVRKGMDDSFKSMDSLSKVIESYSEHPFASKEGHPRKSPGFNDFVRTDRKGGESLLFLRVICPSCYEELLEEAIEERERRGRVDYTHIIPLKEIVRRRSEKGL